MSSCGKSRRGSSSQVPLPPLRAEVREVSKRGTERGLKVGVCPLENGIPSSRHSHCKGTEIPESMVCSSKKKKWDVDGAEHRGEAGDGAGALGTIPEKV